MTVVSDLWRKNHRRQQAGLRGAFADAHQKRLSQPHCLTRLSRMLKVASIRLKQAAGLLSYPSRPALTFTVILFLHLIPQAVQAAEDDPVYCSSEGVITLTDQASIDNFQTTYGPCDTTLYGINIGDGGWNNITNLTGLAGLKTIQDSLRINYVYQLFDYTGLADVQVIEGELYIYRNGEETNGQLHQINMESLVSIGGNLQIDGASNVNRLTAAHFPVLESLGGALEVHSSPSLITLSFPALTTVPSLNLSNIALADLSGFAALTSVAGNINLHHLSITDVDGLLGLTSIAADLTITSNGALRNLDGLTNITAIGGSLIVSGNNTLRNLMGLPVSRRWAVSSL